MVWGTLNKVVEKDSVIFSMVTRSPPLLKRSVQLTRWLLKQKTQLFLVIDRRKNQRTW